MLRKHNTAGGQMERGAWQHTEAETHLPSTTQSCFFGCISCKTEKIIQVSQCMETPS